jgi:hypothetical protein
MEIRETAYEGMDWNPMSQYEVQWLS